MRRSGSQWRIDYSVCRGRSRHWFRDRSPQGRAGRHELARSFRRMRIGNKRVAVLSPVAWRTPPRQYGAWETVASNITEGLVARGWDVTLFATGDSVTRA